MTVDTVGSGIAALAAAVYLIEDAHVAPGDVIMYEPGDKIGGAMVARKVPVAARFPNRPALAYVLPATRVLEREYRCTLTRLISRFSAVDNPTQTMEDDVRQFNGQNPYNDTTRLLDQNHNVISQRRLGLSPDDLLHALNLLRETEQTLAPKEIQQCFTPGFFTSEFFMAWSTLMGPLRAQRDRVPAIFQAIPPCRVLCRHDGGGVANAMEPERGGR